MEINRLTLYPTSIVFTPDMFERWSNRKQRAISSLRNSVALGSEAFDHLTGLFSKRLLSQLAQGAVEFPDGLEIALVGNRVVLRYRD